MAQELSLPAGIAGILQQTFGTDEVTEKTLLAGGLSGSAVYRIVVGGRPYVLKVDAVAAVGLREAAAENLRQAARAGVAPRVYYQNVAEGLTISAFVEGRQIWEVLAGDEVPKVLAATIKRIHALPALAGGYGLWETADRMIGEFRFLDMLRGPAFDEALAGYEQIKKVYPRGGERVFSHNDLNPSNILGDGEHIWVIDWDAAGSNDRFVDLAVAANFFVYTPEHEAMLLDVYFEGRAGVPEQARLFLMRLVVRVLFSMVMFRLAANQRPADLVHEQTMEGITLQAFGQLMRTGQISLASYEGKMMYGKASVNEAVRQIRAPRFPEALAVVAC